MLLLAFMVLEHGFWNLWVKVCFRFLSCAFVQYKGHDPPKEYLVESDLSYSSAVKLIALDPFLQWMPASKFCVGFVL